jgi:hypothetical protein
MVLHPPQGSWSGASVRSVNTPGRARSVHRPQAEADHPAVVGPFGVRPQLRARLPRLVHVLAESEEVPAGAFGFDAGLGDQHRLFPPVTSGLVYARWPLRCNLAGRLAGQLQSGFVAADDHRASGADLGRRFA